MMTTGIFSVVYATLWPLLLVKPEIVRDVLLQIPANSPDDEIFFKTTGLLGAIFIMLITTIAPMYAYAFSMRNNYSGDKSDLSQDRAIVLVDLSVFQRVVQIAPGLLLSAMESQTVYQTLNVCIMIIVVDIVGAYGHGVLAPGGLWEVRCRLTKWVSGATLGQAEGYLTWVFAAVATVCVAGVSTKRLSALVVCLQCFFSGNWVWYFDHGPKPEGGSSGRTIFLLLQVAGCGLEVWSLQSDIQDPETIALALHALCLVVSVVSTRAAIALRGISTLAVYGLMWHAVSLTANGLFYWCICWASVNFLCTLCWKSLFSGGYDIKQLRRISGTYFQDFLLSLFMTSLGAILVKAESPYYLTYPVGLLLPLITLWFALETKLLTHLWTGTPFHPSWAVPPMDDPADPVTPQYSRFNIVNWTFSIGTVLITAVLTTYAAYAVVVSVGENPVTWKLVAANGAVFVWHSGVWMIIASSGVPSCSNDKAATYGPPPIPPLLKCDPHSCLPIHKIDLSFGIVLMLVAGLTGALDNPTASVENTVWLLLRLSWLTTFMAKFATHRRFWGVKFDKKVAKKD